jgi:hypothetical protein
MFFFSRASATFIATALWAAVVSASPAPAMATAAFDASLGGSILQKRAKDAALDHTSASWIWTNEATTVASRPFRFTYASTTGKSASFAVCQAAADDSFDLYIDGEYIGSSQGYTTSKRFYADLNPQTNVFAATVTNGGGPAGFIMACRIVYSDGTVDSIVTDGTWKTLRSAPPANFQSPMFDDAAWVAATNEGRYGTAQPWGNVPTFSDTPLPPVPSLSNSKWIWTKEMTSSTSPVPIGSRPFRRTYGFSKKKVAKYAIILISADNANYLWVNDLPVGRTNGWTPAHRYVVDLASSNCDCSVLFAVEGLNDASGGPAALLFSAQIIYDDGSWDTIISDTNWKTLRTVPPINFMDPDFNDGSWEATVAFGGVGVAPWGNVAIPAI